MCRFQMHTETKLKEVYKKYQENVPHFHVLVKLACIANKDEII